jgi:hypothetical protein
MDLGESQILALWVLIFETWDSEDEAILEV